MPAHEALCPIDLGSPPLRNHARVHRQHQHAGRRRANASPPAKPHASSFHVVYAVFFHSYFFVRGPVREPANVWPHELETAKSLAKQGRVVEFLPRNEGHHESSADVMMDGVVWEMKAPKATSLAAIERNIRRACRQSRHVILDVRRMHGIPAAALEREARSCVRRVKELEGLILVGKDGSVVGIL